LGNPALGGYNKDRREKLKRLKRLVEGKIENKKKEQSKKDNKKDNSKKK
jgi:hypothetical protein